MSWARLVLRYGCAVVSVAAALSIELVAGVTTTGVAPLFFAAVMLSTWYGGLGPGLLATALAGFAVAFFFLEPFHSTRMDSDEFLLLGAFLGVALLISYLHNATKRSQAAAAQANEKAQAANRAKDRFLAVLSHELRNPLNPALAAAAMHERDASLPEPVRRDAAMIRRNIELEVRLIDDLLDISRLTAGKLHFRFEDLDAHELIRDAADICRHDIENKGLRLELDLRAEARRIRADGARMRQVIWNLLKNAAKFTPEGGTIAVRTRNETDASDQLAIEVADTGIGLDAESLTRVFEAFEQVDDAITRRYGGLGLGLAIARSIVTAHGGTIEASSAGRGRGATFTVRLGAQRPAPQPAPAGMRAGNGERALRILLVEDHEDTSRILKRLLESMGHAVAAAPGVESAMAAAETQSFDLALCDLHLVDGSGLDLMRELRRRYGLRGLALSGYGAEEDFRRSRDAGFERHLVKPIRLDDLQAALDACGAVPPQPAAP